jgi:hypothetical protein
VRDAILASGASVIVPGAENVQIQFPPLKLLTAADRFDQQLFLVVSWKSPEFNRQTQ